MENFVFRNTSSSPAQIGLFLNIVTSARRHHHAYSGFGIVDLSTITTDVIAPPCKRGNIYESKAIWRGNEVGVWG